MSSGDKRVLVIAATCYVGFGMPLGEEEIDTEKIHLRENTKRKNGKP